MPKRASAATSDPSMVVVVASRNGPGDAEPARTATTRPGEAEAERGESRAPDIRSARNERRHRSSDGKAPASLEVSPAARPLARLATRVCDRDPRDAEAACDDAGGREGNPRRGRSFQGERHGREGPSVGIPSAPPTATQHRRRSRARGASSPRAATAIRTPSAASAPRGTAARTAAPSANPATPPPGSGPARETDESHEGRQHEDGREKAPGARGCDDGGAIPDRDRRRSAARAPLAWESESARTPPAAAAARQGPSTSAVATRDAIGGACQLASERRSDPGESDRRQEDERRDDRRRQRRGPGRAQQSSPLAPRDRPTELETHLSPSIASSPSPSAARKTSSIESAPWRAP